MARHNKNSLLSLVKDLVATGKEGSFWDFKEKWHHNKALLLHDILCLANTDHSGDRYLIFGIADDGHSVIGVDGDENRKTQSDVISFFRDNARRFASRKTPDLVVETIFFEGKPIDVVRIVNSARKPFRLIEPYPDKGKTCSTAIYSRIEDRNTPIDRCAEDHEVDRMYLERFGLSLSPKERLKLLLRLEKFSWSSIEQDVWVNETFPEFSMDFSGDASDIDEEWLRGEVGYHLQGGSRVSPVLFKYFGNSIAKMDYVSFDNDKKKVARPTWAPIKGGRVYFYEADSLALAFQEYLSSVFGRDDSKNIRFAHDRSAFDLPVLESKFIECFFRINKARPESEKEKQDQIFCCEMKRIKTTLREMESLCQEAIE